MPEQPTHAFIFHGDQINPETAKALAKLMNPCMRAGTIEKIEIPKLLPPASSKGRRYTYTPQFEAFWAMMSQQHKKTSKPRAMAEWDAALKRRHKPEIIMAGAITYMRDETRRLNADPDGQVYHPHRWIKDDRFLDAQSNHPGKPKKSRSDLLVIEVEKLLSYSILGHDRYMLLCSLDDKTITMDKIKGHANTWTGKTKFLEWLRTAQK